MKHDTFTVDRAPRSLIENQRNSPPLRLDFFGICRRPLFNTIWWKLEAGRGRNIYWALVLIRKGGRQLEPGKSLLGFLSQEI